MRNESDPTNASGLWPPGGLQPAADPSWADQLVEANERLIVAALHADQLAESAVNDLDELTRAGQHDALTGTPNRALMLDRLEHAIAVARRNGSHVAILFVDLDDFKRINDTRGHAVGDEILKSAARALESVVRESDTVSRHGGDEFLVLLAEISQPAAAASIATKMLAALAAPIRVGADVHRLSASIGIAVFPDDGNEASMLVHRADKAMYRSKRRSHGRYAFHGEASGPTSTANISDDAARRPSGADMQAVLREQRATLQDPGHDDLARQQLAFRTQIASALRSSFTPLQDRIDLLNQIENIEPLLQVLVASEIGHLSTSIKKFSGSTRYGSVRFTRGQTTRTDQFDAVSDDGLHYAILEFTVTERHGAMDQTNRLLTHKSFGLANGDRIYQLAAGEFEIADAGVLLHRS